MIFKDKGILKAMWAGMFFLCALMSFVPRQEGANRFLLLVFGLLFFLPPALLVYQCCRTGDRVQLRLVRNIAIISLSATTLLLVISPFSIFFSEAVGNALQFILNIVSTPMVCCQYWILSLLLWAGLLWSSLIFLKKTPK